MSLNIRNAQYTGAENRKQLYDLKIPEHFNNKVILFIHGFMGFKDWGCWNLMMDYFNDNGYGFCKFNLTHNGTTLNSPIDFEDPEAFGIDSYFKELTDLQSMVNEVSNLIPKGSELYLLGHSRGGGIALLGANDPRIDGVITLASISSIEKRFPVGGDLDKWRIEGVKYVTNSRTNQTLPQYFVQYEEYIAHKEVLNIELACRAMTKPVLIIHGDADSSVNISEGFELSEFTGCELKVIHEADHVFGSKHPWEGTTMPAQLVQVCETIDLFLSKLDH